ncbi:hypothetical protein P3T27_006593 [Kitasatospora sp. MAA19]|uniref:hypothetical protein n=1 Tax=Kitasatospora sp. MAA19 TaxID=3035090 RepID=UPI0024734E11|nr:hypothetical protein [Kitasatospora sp. MAA19]MDH6709844.1 hypothetical protein [Kitasatospora sp. MAA19]
MKSVVSGRFVGKAGLAVGVAIVLAACTAGGGGGTTSGKPPHRPALTDAVDSVNAALGKASEAKNLTEFDTALVLLGSAAGLGGQKLGWADDPADAGAATAKNQMVFALTSLADDVATLRSHMERHRVCALSSAKAELGASGGLADASKALTKLAAAGYSASLSVPQLPKQQIRSLQNGTMVRGGKTHGQGAFEVDNSGTTDAVVSLALNGKAVHSVFVAKGQKAGIESVEDGTYEVYVAYGSDWDTEAKGFTLDCEYSKFEDTFAFETGRTTTSWTITLQQTTDGNAKTNDVDPNAFPQP